MTLTPRVRARVGATIAASVAGFVWWTWRGAVPAAVALVALALAGLAWASPRHYAPVQRALDRLAEGILVVVTWGLLGLVSLGVLLPLRAWRRLTRQDPLQLRLDPVARTYFRRVPPGVSNPFQRQF